MAGGPCDKMGLQAPIQKWPLGLAPSLPHPHLQFYRALCMWRHGGSGSLRICWDHTSKYKRSWHLPSSFLTQNSSSEPACKPQKKWSHDSLVVVVNLCWLMESLGTLIKAKDMIRQENIYTLQTSTHSWMRMQALWKIKNKQQKTKHTTCPKFQLVCSMIVFLIF